MKKIAVPFAFLCLIFLFVLLFFHHIFYSPLGKKKVEKIIYIPSGASFNEVLKLLEKENIVEYPYKLVLCAKILKKTKSIKAGEYRVNSLWSAKELLDHLCKGRVLTHKVKIPEGLTWWQVGRIIEKSGLTTFEEFKKCVFDPFLLKSLGVPQNTAEGFLFPDTYFFLKEDKEKTARKIVSTMIQEFWKKTDKYLWHGKRPDPKRLLKIVILASLVEKETSIESERPIIAGVFLNRLKRGMLLQCDPTVIYGIGPKFNGNLTKKDLKDKSNLYNTYVYKGLPPTPICSPSLASLKAVLHPAKHNYLYFVAKGDGTHIFSKTLKQHNLAVKRYILKQN